MKPSRITLLLILILLATNIFLVLNIKAAEKTKNTLPEHMISDAVQLLERSGITVDPSVIPYIRPDIPIFEGGVTQEELTAFAEAFCGSKAEGVFNPPEGGISLSAGGYIYEFPGMLSFSLYRQDEVIPASAEDALNGLTAPAPDKSLDRKVKKDIKALFVLNEDAMSQAEIEGFVSLGDESYVVTVRRLTQGLEVDGQIMRVYVKDGKIKAARGDWYFEEYKGEYTMPLMDSVNILFNAKDSGEEFSGIIKQIKLHYNVIWHQSDKYYLIPSWKVIFEDGRELIFNALTGDLIS